MQNEPLFLPASFFMARIPCLPINDFFHFLCKDDLSPLLFERYSEEEQVREAIAIASPSLYKTLENKNKKTDKQQQQTISSLLKYLLRMSTRATPFGTFSFVSTGSWNDKASAAIDLTKVKKRARPDMEWLLEVIDKICNQSSLSLLLPVRKNPMLYSSGGRTFLSYVQKKNEEHPEAISIRSSFLTESIFEESKDPISIGELKEKVSQRFPDLNRDKIHGVINTLLEKQFLCPALLPSLLVESPFEELLESLSSIALSHAPLENLSILKDLASLITTYNQQPFGQGESALQNLQEEMEKIVASPNFIQVDCVYTGDELTLPSIVAKELGKAAEVRWRLSFGNSSSYPLRSYHTKFLDKYGTVRLVPLLELLNEDTGLGTPENYLKSSQENFHLNSHINPKEVLWKKWLKNQWSACIHQNKKEIVLTDEILDKLLGKPEKEKATLSFDLFCEIIADSPSKIDEGDFLLFIFSNSWHAGSTSGRFLDILGDQTKEQMKALFLTEESLEKMSLFAESSYFPSLARRANMATHPNFRKWAIDLGGGNKKDGRIDLEDIYVGITPDRFYLTLKEMGKELVVTANNLLNPTYAPTPLRFIRDVARSKYMLMSQFSWGDLEEVSFLPRVRFNKTILSPAQWKLDFFQLEITEKDKLETIQTKFLNWATQWKMPRYFYMTEGYDNRILMDGNHSSHLSEIASQIKKNREVRFVEKIGQEDGQWVKSQRGVHLSEFVVPFVKNEKYSSAQSLTFPLVSTSVGTDRLKTPGSDWLFAKFYIAKDNEENFLIEHCQPFVEFLFKKEIINQWFFIRYSDPKPHLRIRFQTDKEQIFSRLFPSFHNWSTALLRSQHIQDMHLSSYERELERYGGNDLIEFAEALFCADTKMVISLLAAVLEKKTDLAEEVIAALSLIDMLKQLGLDHKKQISFFSSSELSKHELGGFREWKTPLLTFGEAILEDNLASYNEMIFLNEIFERRSHVFNLFGIKMKELEESGRLTSSPKMILDSVLHMHCNRFLGRDSKREKKSRLYAFHTLFSLEEKRMRIKN
ncbi:MAG: lantibiotic dehydratase [Chlamydiales bacterium]